MKKYLKCGAIVLICLVIVGVGIGACINKRKKSRKIECDQIGLKIYTDDFDVEKVFAKSIPEKCGKFDYNDKFDYSDKKNIGKVYTVGFSIKLGKGLKSQIDKVDAKVNFSKEAMNYWIAADTYKGGEPFAPSEGADGDITLRCYGITRNLSKDDLYNILKKCSVEVKMNYQNGKTKTQTIHFDDAKCKDLVKDYNPLIEQE